MEGIELDSMLSIAELILRSPIKETAPNRAHNRHMTLKAKLNLREMRKLRKVDIAIVAFEQRILPAGARGKQDGQLTYRREFDCH